MHSSSNVDGSPEKPLQYLGVISLCQVPVTEVPVG
jgi:hypothetical protein